MELEVDRRKNKRVKTKKLFFKLKGKDIHGNEIEKLVPAADISKVGASFETDLDFEIGSEIYLSIPLPSKVIRIEKNPVSGKTKYAVLFETYEVEE